jgi:transcriptional regulator with XRE-family HTH domain
MSESTSSLDRDGFDALFAEAEQHSDFWEEDAIIRFAEDVYLAMERVGLSRAELARRLGTSKAYVTKVLRGNANFTLKSMARLALALDSELRMHLAPRESPTYWFDDLAFRGAKEYRVGNTGTGAVETAGKALDEDWSIAA